MSIIKSNDKAKMAAARASLAESYKSPLPVKKEGAKKEPAKGEAKEAEPKTESPKKAGRPTKTPE